MFDFKKRKNSPLLLGAVWMPPFLYGTQQELPKLEEWLVRNVARFVDGGFDSVMIQDSTPYCDGLDTKSIVYISALSYAVTKRFPHFPIGLIIESNNARNAITIAAAANMQYVRCKVFVGAMQKPAGLVEGSAHEAFHYRHLADHDVSLCVDIFDRMGAPLNDKDYALAVAQSKKYGANAVILTGNSFEDTCRILDNVHTEIPSMPILAGGGINSDNLLEAAKRCDGMIISSCLTVPDCKSEWDQKAIENIVHILRG